MKIPDVGDTIQWFCSASQQWRGAIVVRSLDEPAGALEIWLPPAGTACSETNWFDPTDHNGWGWSGGRPLRGPERA